MSKRIRRAAFAAFLTPFAVALLLACGENAEDHAARDVSDSGAAEDVIGRPEGSDSIPDQMRGSAAGQNSDSVAKFRLPERRPTRKPPVLTSPDSADTTRGGR